MNKAEVQHIVNRVYPMIKRRYGLTRHMEYPQYPQVKLHHNIYARITGEENMNGEVSPAAEFERETNTIWIYWPQATNTQWVIETLLHEYTHYLQDGKEMTRLYAEGFEYDNHPFELEAQQKEKYWTLYDQT